MRARPAPPPPASAAPARSEIAGNTSYFPIAVAHWLGTVATIDFLAGRRLIECGGAPALIGLGERPPRRLAEFAAARASNREATCLIFRPPHLQLLVAGKSGAPPRAPVFHSRQILAHMLGKVQLFMLGERHDRPPRSLRGGVSSLTASPRPPADRRRRRKVSNGRPNQLASSES